MLEAPLARVNESPAKRLSQYRQEHAALQEFVNRLLTPGFDPAFDDALTARALAVLRADPTLAEAVLTAITPGRRGPTRQAAHSPAAALVKRTYEAAQHTNQKTQGTYISPGYLDTADPQVPRPSSPYRGRRGDSHRGATSTTALRPSDGAIEVADATEIAGEEHPTKLCFKATCAFLWDSDTTGLDEKVRGRVAQLAGRIRETLTKKKIAPEEQPAEIAQRLTRERWCNALGNLPRTLSNVEKNWYTAMYSKDADQGRSNGVTTSLYVNGTVRQRESFSQMEARRSTAR